MGDTTIEWTDKVWNPVTGCTAVHEGCRNCYAKRIAGRHLPGHGFDARDFSVVRCHEDRLEEPLHWRKPQLIFVDSMGDLFHKDVPFEFIDKAFAVMALCPQHTFIVLTKRPERMREWFNRPDDENYSKHISNPSAWYVWRQTSNIQRSAKMLIGSPFTWTEFAENDSVSPWPLPNVILGVSICDQPTADEFIPILLQTPAARRAVSIEPMLGPVDLKSVFDPAFGTCLQIDALEGKEIHHDDDYCYTPTSKLDWVITGGETGPGARPIHPDWGRSLRDRCQSAGVPFFFKSWGEWAPESNVGYHEKTAFCRYGEFHAVDGEWIEACLCTEGAAGAQMYRVGKKVAGCMLDGREWTQFPEVR